MTETDHMRQALARAQRHHEAGRLDQSLAVCREVVASYPDSPEAYNSLGGAYQAIGYLDEALNAYGQALALRPDFPAAWYNRGNALREKGYLDGAVAAYRHALSLRPDTAAIYNNLAGTLDLAGRMDEAIVAYERAASLQPDMPMAHSNLVYALHSHPGYDAMSILQAHLRWRAQHADRFKQHIHPHLNDRSLNRRLRIGYVSAFLCDHVLGRFLVPLLTWHDRQHFEIFCYASLRQPPDSVTQQLSAHTDQWRDIAHLSDDQGAQLIRDDRIDILVDLGMHMAGSRLLIFARKPAPVQVTYLAYCSTTGLDTIDYRLTDPYFDPPGETDQYYTEKSFRLAETYWCYPAPAEAPDVGPLPVDSNGHITFGCLNNFCKVSVPALDAWCQLLRIMPGSRLLLHAHEGSHRRRVRDLLASAGIDLQRLRFVDYVPPAQYFQLYHQIDIALDPFPYAGGTTSCDSLWMGVPLVTLHGQTAVGRGGVSILSNLALTELIARNTDQYISLAASLAGDLPRLSALRSTLRQRMLRSPLMDAPRFARHVEAAYRQMWTMHLASTV